MTQNLLRVVIVDQTPLPKIVIVEQTCFILVVLHGSYNKDFSPLIKEKHLQNCG